MIEYILIFMFYVGAVQWSFAQPDNDIYEGGNGGGYDMKTQEIVNLNFFKGGDGQGFSSSIEKINNLVYFKGANGEGYASSDKKIDNLVYFKGSEGDGYSKSIRCEDFIWTGAIDKDWLMAGNWNYNLLPDLKRRVIIPMGAANFPLLSSGIFAIGDNPNNGAFECGELWIQSGALLVTSSNNKVENYGDILIDGMMRVENTVQDAFQNLNGGLVRITPSAFLLINP